MKAGPASRGSALHSGCSHTDARLGQFAGSAVSACGSRFRTCCLRVLAGLERWSELWEVQVFKR